MEVASESVAIDKFSAEDDTLDNDISSSGTEGLESDASQAEGSTGSYEDVDDQTLLEYARSHGLCTDYTSENPLALDVLGHLQSGHDPEDADLVQDQFSQDFTIVEKFSLDPSSALFLRRILSTCDSESAQDFTKERARKFRVDSPLLLTDTKLDLRLFTQKSNIGNGLETSHFPHLIDRDGSNEELEWLDMKLLAMKDMQTSSEKLQLTQDDTYFLQNACQNSYSDDEDYPVNLQELDFSRVITHDNRVSGLVLTKYTRKLHYNTRHSHCSLHRLHSYRTLQHHSWAVWRLFPVPSIRTMTSWMVLKSTS